MGTLFTGALPTYRGFAHRRVAWAAGLALGLLGVAGRAGADQILQIHSPSLTTYKSASSSSPQQFVRPLAVQRGVGIDGSPRAGGGYGWSFAGNPFGDAMSPRYRIGDVDLSTGSYSPTDVDIALPAPGAGRVVIGRSYNGRQTTNNGGHHSSEGYQGINWFQISHPELKYYSDSGDHANDVIYLIYGADRYLEFKRTGSSSDYYQGRNGAAGVIERVQEYDTDLGDDVDYYVYTDQAGTKTYFMGSLNTGNQAWLFWKVIDTAGNMLYVGDSASVNVAAWSGYTGNLDHISKMYDSAGRRYTFAYSSSTIGFNYRLTQVKVETKASGTWASPSGVVTVAQVDYDYYTTTVTDQGLAGDLKLVTVTTPLTDSGVNAIRKKLYWYYTQSWANSDGRRGEAHELKMVVGNEGYRQRDWADANITNDTPLSDTETDLKPYSDAYFEYADTSGSSKYQISSLYFSGECGCSGGANGTYSITYGSDGADASGYDTDEWRTRSVVAQPDGNYCTYYFDEVGQPLSRVVTNAAPSGSPTKKWATGVTRDANGCVTYIHTPANLTSYTHSTGVLAYSTTVGLVNYFERVPSGDRTGLVQSTMYQAGFSDGITVPIPYYLTRTTYAQRDFQVTSGVNVTKPVVSTRRSYPEATDDYTTGGSYNETSMSYAWWNGTNTNVLYLALKQVTTTLPAVTTTNNGSNASNTTDRYLRQDGTTAFTLAADGVFDYTQYTNGQLTKQIRDVSTSGSFASGDDPQTDWSISDNAAHSNRITEYTYDAQGRMSTTTLPDGRVTESYYSRLKDQRSATISWPRSVSATTRYGPASYSVANQAGKSEMSGVIAITSSGLTDALTTWIDETDADPITALDKGTLASMRTTLYTNTGHQVTEERAYFSIPGSGAGSSGTNYDKTTYGYDDSGRKRRTKTAAGTITRSVFDELGRGYQTWMGTNDNGDAGGESSGTNNMVKISELEFDGGSDGKNSLVTKRTAFVEGTTTDRRDTTYTYDYRGRALLTTNPVAPHTLAAYDNLGRMTASAQYTSTGSITVGTTNPAYSGTQSARVALSKTAYDELGRVWKTTRYKVTQANGTDADSIDSLTWYDPAGRVIEVKGEGGFEKRRYDRLGRLVQRFTLATSDDSQYQHASASTALWNTTTGQTSVAGDIVLVEDQTAYESTDSDNVLMRVSIARLSTDLANGRTGELDSNADGGTPTLLTLTEADVLGRVQITAMWYDAWDRMVDTVRYGTAGIVGDAANHSHTFTRGGLSAPTRSDTALRTTTTFNDDGTVLQVEAPGTPSNLASTSGAKTRYTYDALFRQTAVIRNYVNGSPSSDTADDDQTVQYGYTNGLRTSITAHLQSYDQVTTYIYGTTKGTPSASKIATGHLLRAVKYPDSGNTGTDFDDIDIDSSDVVSYAYNAQGQTTLNEDQAGNIIETTYDAGGRPTSRAVTNLASGFDGAVKRIQTSYLSRGLTDKVTQYDAASSGSVTDEVQYAYDDWGNIASFTQDPDSAIGGGGRGSYALAYTYAKATPTNGRVYLRRTGASYDGNSDLSYTYPSTSNALNDAAGWVYEVKVGSVAVSRYEYYGNADVTLTYLPQTLQGYDCGASMRDNFNRPIESKWYPTSWALPNTPTVYDVQLTYDRNSNITSATDLLRKNGSAQRNYDAKYVMDDLNRLTRAEEGTYSTPNISNRSRDEQWTLDQVGNMAEVKLDLDGNGSFSSAGEMDDTRTHSVANALSTRDTDSTPGTTGNNYTLSYDAAGNMTDDGKDFKYKWDAFGRLRQVKDQSNALKEEHRYNGLGYRIGWHYDVSRSGGYLPDGTLDGNDPWYYFGYDERWRMINTYRDTDADPKERFVYHAAGFGGRGGSSYIDAVILRDKNADIEWSLESDEVVRTLEERRYYCQNWRADVSAVLTDTGKLVESVKYSSYGVPIGLPAGDLYGSGSWGSTENTAFSAAITAYSGAGTYDLKYDLDMDGAITSSDVTQANAVSGGYQSLGRTKLSSPSVDSRKGYAGYEANGSLPLLSARNRWLDCTTGNWLSRDPLGIAEPTLIINSYAYTNDMPVNATDPLGLCDAGQCGALTISTNKHTIDVPAGTKAISKVWFFYSVWDHYIQCADPTDDVYAVQELTFQWLSNGTEVERTVLWESSMMFPRQLNPQLPWWYFFAWDESNKSITINNEKRTHEENVVTRRVRWYCDSWMKAHGGSSSNWRPGVLPWHDQLIGLSNISTTRPGFWDEYEPTGLAIHSIEVDNSTRTATSTVAGWAGTHSYADVLQQKY